MNANDNEEERRRVIAQLQQVVRRGQVASESVKVPEAEFTLRAKRADTPAGPPDRASGQRDSQKAVPGGRVPGPTPPLPGRDSEIKRFGPPGRGWETAFANIPVEEEAEMAPPPGAARSDAMRDHRGEPEDFLREHEKEFSIPVADSANVGSRRYLLGAAAIVIILGVAGLAASFVFHGATTSVDDTDRVTELETPKLEQEQTQTEAAPQDASAAEAQQSSALMDKVEDTSEASRTSEDSGSATTQAHNLPIASPRPQAQDPLPPPIESFNPPALPTGAFSAQEPPQAPAAESPKETPGGAGKIAHAREEAPVEPLTDSPQPPPKRAPLPPRRASAPVERPRAKAAEGKQEGGAPSQEALAGTGGAEANLPSEDIVQRTLESLFNGWERAP